VNQESQIMPAYILTYKLKKEATTFTRNTNANSETKSQPEDAQALTQPVSVVVDSNISRNFKKRTSRHGDEYSGTSLV
jgi:hypothetical protein